MAAPLFIPIKMSPCIYLDLSGKTLEFILHVSYVHLLQGGGFKR